MRTERSALWRVIYIARNERQAQGIEGVLNQAGFLVDRKQTGNTGEPKEDIEIRVLDSEAEEARLYLLDQGL